MTLLISSPLYECRREVKVTGTLGKYVNDIVQIQRVYEKGLFLKRTQIFLKYHFTSSDNMDFFTQQLKR